MNSRLSRLEWIGFLLIAACLGVIQFSIFIAQGLLFSAAGIVWLIVAWQDRRRPETPTFFLPLVMYALWTLLSSAFSVDPAASFWDSRQLLMFLMVPIVARFARGQRAMTTLNVIIALGAAGAVLGIAQYAILGQDSLQHRPRGTLSIYMTYAGILMMVTGAALSRILFYAGQRMWPMIAVPALLVALIVTQTRNAWIGVLAAMIVLLGARRLHLLFIAPVLVGLFFLVAPASLKARALGMFDPNSEVNRDRPVMLSVGVQMTAEHPFFGVGPQMVERMYPYYHAVEAGKLAPPHLHNVPVQIAAERGLPALLAWLWFVASAGRSLVKQLNRGPARAVAGAGVAAVVAMLAAGLFEYNFGDSEFLMLFLGLITLPFAATRSSSDVPAIETA